MSDHYEKWVSDGQWVRVYGAWNAAGAEGPYREGRVVAYCDAPTVLVRLADDQFLHWRADLCRAAASPCKAEEGATGIRCQLSEDGHEFHEGTAVGHQIEATGYPLFVRWPAQDSS